jgi:protein SCO1
LCLSLLLAASSCGGGPDETAAEVRALALDTAGKRIIERKVLPVGTPAPDFELVDQDGNKVTLESMRGSVLGIGFIYTTCPDVCGLLVGSFLELEKKFADEVDGGDLQLVLITTDPETDVPERAKYFTSAHGGKWKFLTGEMEECEQVWEDYGIHRTVNPSAGYVYHTYKIVLVDGEGKLRYEFVGLDDPEVDLIRDLTSLLGEL